MTVGQEPFKGFLVASIPSIVVSTVIIAVNHIWAKMPQYLIRAGGGKFNKGR